MDFSNGQISSSRRDLAEIPAVDRETVTMGYVSLIMAGAFIMILLEHGVHAFRMRPIIRQYMALFTIRPAIALIIAIALVLCSVFFGKSIIFALCKKESILLEFDADKFIFNSKAVKWEELRKITYAELITISRSARYNITVYLQPAGEAPLPCEITGNTIFKASYKKIVQLIADKFYKYYGAVHGVMLKKSFFSDTYELKPVSGKNILQTETLPGADSPVEMPQMFK
ncbi:MAG: hypothetical protein FWC57_03200 [Endomicrobia bacterium]|nr:hypothetical protein [Endomicrobiia bacterium]